MQIPQVNHGIWKIADNSNRVSAKNKIGTQQNTSGYTEVPEGNRQDALAAFFGSNPLNNKTHRKKQLSDKAEDHQIAPIQTKKTVKLAKPSNRADEVLAHSHRAYQTPECRIQESGARNVPSQAKARANSGPVSCCQLHSR